MGNRILALILAALMLTAMLTGCGGKEEPKAQTPSASSQTQVQQVQPQQPAQPKKADTYMVCARVPDTWGTVRLWAWSETKGDLYEAWPGEVMHTSSNGTNYMEIPKEYDYVIINGMNGEIQTGDEWSGGHDISFYIDSDGTYTTSYVNFLETTDS